MQHHEFYEGGAEPSSFDVSMQRPRIRELMLEAVKKPLTAIVANVGSGKTQAASTLYEASNARIMWLQLTPLDNLASRFWDRFGYAVEPYNKELSEELRALGFPETNASLNRCLMRVSEVIEHSGARYILVLDDFHVISNEKLINAFEMVITAKLPRLSIVITSNEKPRINLAALQEKGMLSLITHDDLCMSHTEIIEYYARLGVAVSEKVAMDILNRTDGWLFAVYVIGLSLKKGIPYGEYPIGDGVLDIFGLIESDVYRPMPPNQRRFFLKISILESVSPGLMWALADDVHETVAEVLRWNGILLRLNASTGRYQIMNLFREFMLERHKDLNEAETRDLYETAARWCEENGNQIEAIQYYKGSGNFQRVFDIILQFSSRCPEEIADLFIELIGQAPPEAITQRPIMLVARAKYLLNNARVQEAYEAVIGLRNEYEAMSDSPLRRAVLGEVYAMLGVLSLALKTAGFVDYFKRADALLPNGSELFDDKMVLICGASLITARDLGPGSVQKQTSAFFRAMPHAVRVMNGCGAGLEYLVAAEADFVMGDLKNAEKNAFAALYRAQPRNQHDIECMAYSIMMRIYLYQGDYRRAMVTTETVSKYMSKTIPPDGKSLCDIIVSAFYVMVGRTDTVSRWIREDTHETNSLAPISLNRGQRVRAQCYLAEGKYNELLGYLKHLDEIDQVRNSLIGQIESTVWRAIALYYSGDHKQAFQALTESYQLSFENNIIMLHVEQGKWMRTLVRAAKADKESAIPVEWLDLIHSKASTYAKRLSLVASAYDENSNHGTMREIRLTKREREILTGLCQGLTREQIAQSLSISVNTVKGMLPLIYDKLGATNKSDAVRIAVSHDLIA